MELLKAKLAGVRVIHANKAMFPGKNTRQYRRLRTEIRRLGNRYLAAVLDRQQVLWQGDYATFSEARREAAFERMNIAANNWCKNRFGECYAVEFRGKDVWVEY